MGNKFTTHPKLRELFDELEKDAMHMDYHYNVKYTNQIIRKHFERLLSDLNQETEQANLGIARVGKQRELLIAYETRTNNNYRHTKSMKLIETQVDQFLSNL